MKTRTVSGTYGSHQTECDIIVYETNQGKWYAVDGSLNVNCTFDDIENGVDVELLRDHDCCTAPKPINNEHQLESLIDEDGLNSIEYLLESFWNGQFKQAKMLMKTYEHNMMDVISYLEENECESLNLERFKKVLGVDQ